VLSDDLIDVPVEVFGGYCPAIVPANLPPGAANIAQDVMFPQAGVRTRGGLGEGVVFTGAAIPAGASINGLKTYLTPSGGQRLMIWDSLGDLFKENPQGTLTLINSRPYHNLFCESQTLFGREYQAFFNSLGGGDIPRQYDDTNWDRVSQVGPGSAPSLGLVDENAAYPIQGGIGLQNDGPYGVASATQNGFLVTLVATPGFFGANAAVEFRPGDQYQVTGVAAGYNGTWQISSVTLLIGGNVSITYVAAVSGLAPLGPGGSVAVPYYLVITANPFPVGQFVPGLSVTIAGAGIAGYNGTWQVREVKPVADLYVAIPGFPVLANSGGGTLTIVGNIVAGRHNVSVAFITRQGFITQAMPWAFWTSAGGKRVIVSGIPTGPSNVQQRLLIFTPVIVAPAVTGTFYSLPNGSTALSPSSVMLIPDNVTTVAYVDFLDSILISGFNAEYLFSELELGECAFMLPYNSRGVWLGERNKVPNFQNLTFDGGFTGLVPNGWTPDVTFGAGGSAGTNLGDWADGYVITEAASGVYPATFGMIKQSAYQDSLGVAIIQSATGYSVRVRLKKSANLSLSAQFHINLQSVSLGLSTTGLVVTTAQLTGTYQEFIATLTDAPLANPPADLMLCVYCVDDTPVAGGQVIIDSIEPFPTLTPYNSSTARISRAFNPESFDSITGQVQIRAGDGQQLRAGFPLRNSLYLAKDHYLGYVTDDGVNEPASWTFTEVSATVGICGPNAVDWNEEWAVFAERSGLYLCWGSDPAKITPEIQLDASFTGRTSWASINWAFASTMWVRIDKVNKMILIGAPINGATTPNVVFMMDYRWLDNAEDIAASPLVTYSSFTGKILAHGRGRRWAIWNIAANSMWFAERADGTAQPFFGGVANGTVFWQQDISIQGSDDGAAVNGIYQSYPLPSSMEEQQYQLRMHRKLFGYLKFRAMGSGTLNLAVGTAQRSTILRGYTLSLNPVGDGERPLNIHGERFFMTVSTNAVNSWFQLEKWIACIKKDSAALVRGVSS